MLVEVKVPVLAESVPDATLLEWYKQPGEMVTRGESLIDLETDKVTLEVAAPQTGVLKEIKKRAGDVVLAQDVLAIIDTEALASAAPGAPAAPSAKSRPVSTPADPPSVRFGPAVRKLIEEHRVDPDRIPATGKDGRLMKADVLAYLETGASKPELPGQVAQPTAPGLAAPPDARPEERVAMTRLRRRTAERLLNAQRDNALLTTFNEVNMQGVMDMRRQYKDAFEKEYGVRLGFMSFFVKAASGALKKFPVINASIDGEDILYHGYFDIGVAVGSERGLVVPILRDVERMPFSEVELKIRDFGERARDGRLTIEELTGGTFTISNGGVFGSLLSTPIVNPPQSAILGMHKIEDRPIAEKGEVVIRPMMYLALTYDHRVIDGREAVQFLVTIKQLVEDPARILLQV